MRKVKAFVARNGGKIVTVLAVAGSTVSARADGASVADIVTSTNTTFGLVSTAVVIFAVFFAGLKMAKKIGK